MRQGVGRLQISFPVVVHLIALAGRAAATANAPPGPAEAVVDAGTTRLSVVEVPPGRFMMGTDEVIRADDHWKSCASCPPRNDAEHPAHEVTISRAFWMGRYLVTQGQWQATMGNNPAKHQAAGPNAPVEQVTWHDAQSYIAKLNAAQTRWTVRLPTEAEWEYAARAGSRGDTYGPLDSIAWYGTNSGGTTHPVGLKQPNKFGLYDMLGSVWEWCQDWFGPYPSTPSIDPQGPSDGELRITRGGCFYCNEVHERVVRRNRDLEDHQSASVGFRIVAVPRTGGH